MIRYRRGWTGRRFEVCGRQAQASSMAPERGRPRTAAKVEAIGHLLPAPTDGHSRRQVAVTPPALPSEVGMVQPELFGPPSH
ncbi:hypothetical protein GCM10028772_10070 [Nocardioides ultimimeridianus]